MTDLVLGIDTGGTYTDGVLLEYQSRQVVATTKTLTTRHDLTECILTALDDLLPDDREQIRLVAISTTLATNAIAEGKGRPVGLFLLGYDPDLVKKFNMEHDFATGNYHYVAGGHTLHGEEQTPLDVDTILEHATALQDDVEAFAVSGYFSPFNNEHEERAFAAINDATGRPVVLGHQLASKLNSVQRATTATLNASLLSILQDFILAMRNSLDERNITAPLMVVRGDGALMSSDIGEKRPVETVHSGPAASAIGGRFLAERDNALVIDIGGTTTDIAVVDGGQVNILEEGTSVGDYQTAVRAAHIRSIGLGGDSMVTFNIEDRLTIGPARVTPLAYLANTNGYVAEKINNLMRHGSKRGLDHLEFWYLQREPGRMITNDRARKVLAMLEKHPMALPDILEQMELFHPLQFGGQSLIKEEIIGRAALTPTDLLHVTGQFAPWNQEAAQTAAALIARLKGWSVQKLIDEVMTTIAERITAEVIAFISGQTLERVPDYVHPDDLGLWLFEESLYQEHPYLGSDIFLKIPIIGIGAPAEIFLPPVAEMLNTELITPPHYQVANAVGAVAGSVMIYEEAWVFPQTRGKFVIGYYVQTSDERASFSKMEQALAFAKEITREKALAQAQAAGAVKAHVEIEQIADGAESYRIRAKAIGNPELG